MGISGMKAGGEVGFLNLGEIIVFRTSALGQKPYINTSSQHFCTLFESLVVKIRAIWENTCVGDGC